MRRMLGTLMATGLLLAACGDDDGVDESTATTEAAETTTTPVAVELTDGPWAALDCMSIHTAYAAAIDDEADAAIDYLDPEDLRTNGTFDEAAVNDLLDDPSAEALKPFVDACEDAGHDL